VLNDWETLDPLLGACENCSDALFVLDGVSNDLDNLGFPMVPIGFPLEPLLFDGMALAAFAWESERKQK
jgi:hypothetical protein